MATPGELFGGFWDDVAPSPVIDAYAAVYGLIAPGVVDQTNVPRLRVHVISANQTTQATASNGRAVTAYPRPTYTPVWMSPNSTTGPLWCAGLDFETTGDVVVFDVDPLTSHTTRSVWVDGAPVGTTTLWYGAAATETAVDPPDGSFGALVGAIAAAADSPAAVETETVRAVYTNDVGTQVATDTQVYRLGPDDATTYAVGSTLPAGAPVGTAWSLTRLGPDKPALTHLTIPAAFFQEATTGAIMWPDETKTLVVDTVSTRTRVRFQLGASSQIDLDAFWTASHANGVANGKTLAQALDTRTAPTNDPDAASLPVTINPLELVCRELLAGNAWLLLTDSSRFGLSGLTAAEVLAAAVNAARPYATVFGYDGAQPTLTQYNPS